MHSLTQQPITHSTVVVESRGHADDYSQLNKEGKPGLSSSIYFLNTHTVVWLLTNLMSNEEHFIQVSGLSIVSIQTHNLYLL